MSTDLEIERPLPLAPITDPVVRRLPAAGGPRVLPSDLAWAIGTYTAVIIGIWVTHGGWTQLGDGVTGVATALTQLTGLAASAVGLVGLVLVARPRMLERRYGLDRLLNQHRVLGEIMAVLIGVHVAAAVFAWQVGGAWGAAISDLTGRQPYMAGATVGALLIGIVTVSSLRSIRTNLAYETWYFVHLTAYLALGLSFGHQIVTGTDFANDAVARWSWIGLHVVVLAALVWGRWGRLVESVVRPLRVVSVEPAGPDVMVVRLGGGRLRTMTGAAGQFCYLRPLTGDGWWRCNPFSLSAAPTERELRFSVKDRGDSSSLIGALRPGTKVAVEGPYGVCTSDVLGDRQALFVVGGVGVAPVRAMLEDLPPASAPVVLYRARSEADLVHFDEIRELVAERGGRVHTLVGRSERLAVRDPFSANALRRAVPDVADRVAVLCGPDRLISAARSGLRAAGVQLSDIHYEHAWW